MMIHSNKPKPALIFVWLIMTADYWSLCKSAVYKLCIETFDKSFTTNVPPDVIEPYARRVVNEEMGGRRSWIYRDQPDSRGICPSGMTVVMGQTPDAIVDENENDVPLFNLTCVPSLCDCTVSNFEIPGEKSAWFGISPVVVLPSGEYISLVTLVRAFDYEEEGAIVFIEPVAKCAGINQERTLGRRQIQVTDLPDSIPTFSSSLYVVSVPENQPLETAVVTGIVAIDGDSGDTVGYTVDFSVDQLKLFEGNVSSQVIDGSSRRALDIILKSPLNYETSTRHRFTVLAKDSSNLSDTCDVVINVMDIQDIPPSFSLPFYTAQVRETALRGSMVVSVSAIDGDISDISNAITYSIKEGPVNLFEIDNITGVITVSGNLDIDGNEDIQNGQIQMVIEAKELNTSGQPQYGQSASTVQVLVLIEDANDNKPEFNDIAYAGSIREDAVMDETMSMDEGGVIFVVDKDKTPDYNGFTLHLQKDGAPWSVFEPSVKTVFAQASVLILLKQPDALNGLASTHLEFQIVATETTGNTSTRTSTSADVMLWIQPPAAMSEAVVDIPLRTSDFIIFVIGFLILFNMILTLLLCILIRRQNNTGTGLFNRNHKYYVSERDRSPSRMPSKLKGKDNEDHDPKEVVSTLSPPKDKEETSNIAVVNENTKIRNTVASAVNRSRCDVVPIESQNEIPVPKSLVVSNGTSKESSSIKRADTSNHTELREQAALPNTKNVRRCDVTPLKPLPAATILNVSEGDSKSSPPQQTNVSSNSTSLRCDVIPHETNTSISSLLQRVHQKLASVNRYVSKNDPDACDLRPITEDDTSLESSFSDVSHSNGSSFSNKEKCDVTPLIYSQDINKRDKNKTDLKKAESNGTAHVNFAFSGDVPKAGKEAHPEIRRSAAPNPPTTFKRYPLYPSPSSTDLPPLSASQEQITKTGVPPIALALPFSTGVVPKEQQPTVTNPVFKEEPISSKNSHTSTKDDEQHAEPTYSTINKHDPKAEETKTTDTPLQRNNTNPLPKPPRTQNLPSDSTQSKRESAIEGVKPQFNMKNGPVATPSDQILPHSPQMTRSEPSLKSTSVMPNQDFLTAAKKLLHTASFNKTSQVGSQEEPADADAPSKPPRNISSQEEKSTEKLTQF